MLVSPILMLSQWLLISRTVVLLPKGIATESYVFWQEILYSNIFEIDKKELGNPPMSVFTLTASLLGLKLIA
jgi:hypothetical protein